MADEPHPLILYGMHSEHFQQLEQRVSELEEHRPGEGPQSEAEARLAARLDRHRDELDELKRRYNDLARYVTRHIKGDPNDGNDQAGDDSGAGAEAPGGTVPG